MIRSINPYLAFVLATAIFFSIFNAYQTGCEKQINTIEDAEELLKINGLHCEIFGEALLVSKTQLPTDSLGKIYFKSAAISGKLTNGFFVFVQPRNKRMETMLFDSTIEIGKGVYAIGDHSAIMKSLHKDNIP